GGAGALGDAVAVRRGAAAPRRGGRPGRVAGPALRDGGAPPPGGAYGAAPAAAGGAVERQRRATAAHPPHRPRAGGALGRCPSGQVPESSTAPRGGPPSPPPRAAGCPTGGRPVGGRSPPPLGRSPV